MQFPTDLTPVIIESPFAPRQIETREEGLCQLSEEDNLAYVRACMQDALVNHHEAPYASHALYTQPGVLDDTIPEERRLGMGAGFVWARLAQARVFYIDRGFSGGMVAGLRDAIEIGQRFEFRRLRGTWELGYEVQEPEIVEILARRGVSVESL